jgi:PAP2 superfamily protein
MRERHKRTPKPKRALVGVLFVALVLSHSLFAQQSGGDDSELKGFSRRFLQEERDLWTSPLRIHQEDIKWLLPLGAGTAGFVLVDRKVSEDVSETPGLQRPSNIVSQMGAAPLVAVPLSMIVLGHFSHNARTVQAGSAGLEAFLHSGLIVQVLKTATNRERPNKTSGDGGFWDGGKSFPSGHAITIWAFAAAMSDQYPDKRWVGVSGYSVATAVSFARVGSLNHFPSDVLVGSSLGWLIGHYVSRHHPH